MATRNCSITISAFQQCSANAMNKSVLVNLDIPLLRKFQALLLKKSKPLVQTSTTRPWGQPLDQNSRLDTIILTIISKTRSSGQVCKLISRLKRPLQKVTWSTQICNISTSEISQSFEDDQNYKSCWYSKIDQVQEWHQHAGITCKEFRIIYQNISMLL